MEKQIILFLFGLTRGGQDKEIAQSRGKFARDGSIIRSPRPGNR
jgi:hypothetical protein